MKGTPVRFSRVVVRLTCWLIAAAALAQGGVESRPPTGAELALPAALGTSEVVSPLGVVVASSEAAAWAGRELLESGGNAVDAAVAAAFAAGVSEPGSAGLGGQTVMVLALADGRLVAIDGAGMAPRSTDRLRLWAMRAARPVVGALETAAVPGTVAGLALALNRYGTRSLAEVLAPAIEAAELGTAMPEYERALLVHYAGRARSSPQLRSTLLVDGWEMPGPGRRYCLPDLACTLRRLAVFGAEDFYRGGLAADIESEMIAGAGAVRRGDLAGYRALERRPVRGSYRGYEIVSFPYPGCGAAVVAALQILDSYPSEVLAAGGADRLHVISEAVRLALADVLPGSGLEVSADLAVATRSDATRRASLIRLDRALSEDELEGLAPPVGEGRDTSQITVADAAGNVVSLTTTLGRTFGSGATSPGLGLTYNSLLLNFDLENPASPAFLRAGAAPFSTMAPTVVVADGRPVLALGSAGSEIITAVIVNVISNVLDARLPLCEAVAAPRVVARYGSPGVELEMVAPITAHDAGELERRGFVPLLRRWFPTDAEGLCRMGSANAVQLDHAAGLVIGVGDPRRQGVAMAARWLDRPRPSPVAGLPCWRWFLGRAAAPGTGSDEGAPAVGAGRRAVPAEASRER